MQKAGKKGLFRKRMVVPTWLAVVLIAVVIVVVVLIWGMGTSAHRPLKYTAKARAQLQDYINKGGVPRMQRKELEGLGIVFPPDYAERVQRRQAEFEQMRLRIRREKGG